jgi:hypothetical protein
MDNSAKQNLKYLEDIEKYNEAHEKDFKQVFFKPQAGQINSSPVGAFIKDIYGVEQVAPVAQIPGYHTRASCELNTAIYANSTIDYNSPTTYVPGLYGVKVDGDFANSPNYFLTGTQVLGQIFSVELRGYIAAQKPGTYSVSINASPFFKKNALIWVGNNALKTYRKENAHYIVENGVQKKNQSFKMVTGEYTPFRIQYSLGEDVMIDHKNLWTNGDGYPISVFAKNPNENNLYYYSLSPSDKINYYNCDVYKGSDLQKYKTDAKQYVKLVWQKQLDENTEYVFLDIIGNLCEYDANYQKFGVPIYQIQDPISNQTRPGRYKLELYQRKFQPLCIKYPNNTVVPITPAIEDLDTVRNNEWEKASNPLVKVMTNKEEQVGDKRISIDRISESNPLYSENFRYKLCIMRDRENKKILALLASTRDKRQFYTAEPDLKMNKLFYASTYIENKFLREVPASLQTNGNTYATYSDKYPVSTNGYTESPHSDSNNCEKQCNELGVQCNHYYKVTNTAGVTNCLISNKPVTSYLPKQPGSTYTTSTLNIKNKIIQTGDATKDAIYNKTQYISNGYSDTVNSRFSDYPVERKVLSNTDTPGPEGTSYVVDLKNNINESTNGTKPFSATNVNNPMIAGKIENFTTVVGDSLTKLNQIDSDIKQHKTNQYTVAKNRIDISNNITSINQTYMDMSGNQKKYDFTGQTIYALEEDRTLESALLKDNAIYKEEQNNLYMITTLTMATLLVTAILISK